MADTPHILTLRGTHLSDPIVGIGVNTRGGRFHLLLATEAGSTYALCQVPCRLHAPISVLPTLPHVLQHQQALVCRSCQKFAGTLSIPHDIEGTVVVDG